jgi:branched-chain amino acid transport system permease protein
MTTFFVHIAILICIYILVALGLNLAVGYTGQVSLGHIAFFGVGAYTSALLSAHHYPFIVCFIAAGLLAAAAGLAITLITRRLAGDYFALVSLGFSFIAYSIFLSWESLTHGPLGIAGIARPRIFGFAFNTLPLYLVLCLIVVVLAVAFFYRLVNSPYGKLLQAVRDEKLGAASLGKNVLRLKYQSMMVAACLTGLGGSLFAHYISFIDPMSFFLSEIILAFTIVIVGGLASLRGTVVAAILIVLLPELLRFLSLPSSVLGPLRQIIYALLLLGILLVRPRGLFGKVDLND